MPCLYCKITIIQRSENESVVSVAAYQSGEKLFSEYDQEQKHYPYKTEVIHREILLQPHAPPTGSIFLIPNVRRVRQTKGMGMGAADNGHLQRNGKNPEGFQLVPEQMELRFRKNPSGTLRCYPVVGSVAGKIP